MLTQGEDFQFENAEEDFKNLDKLIKVGAVRCGAVRCSTVRCGVRFSLVWLTVCPCAFLLLQYVNADGRVNLFYSTPTIYTKAKLAAAVTYRMLLLLLLLRCTLVFSIE